jgi:phosphoribosylformylglycinamidine synthase subunit PurS
MKVRVLVRLKPGVLDVQGKAVENGIHGLGHGAISAVRVGRMIEFEVPSSSQDEARNEAEEVCKKLLVNPIIENFEIQLS